MIRIPKAEFAIIIKTYRSHRKSNHNIFVKLPNRDKAYIQSSKLIGYLLSETHPDGKSKAKLLRAVGFNQTNIDMLEQGLLSIAQNQDVKEIISSPHGVKYVIEGNLPTPLGGFVFLLTVWIIDKGQETPRFVTAYPC